MACWVAAAMHLLLLCNAAAAARAAVALFAAVDGTTPLPPRLSLAEAAAATGTGDYDDGTTGDKGSQAIVGSPIVAGAMNDRLRALTSSFAIAIGKKLDYCIKDTYVRAASSFLFVFLACIALYIYIYYIINMYICRETEWNQAFDFSKDTTFLTNCMKETKGTYVSVRIYIYMYVYHMYK